MDINDTNELQKPKKAASQPGSRALRWLVSVSVLLVILLAIYRVWSVQSYRDPGYPVSDVVYSQPLHFTHSMTGMQAMMGSSSVHGWPADPPRISAKDTFFDFGRVSSTRVVTHTFPIANQGKGILVIWAGETTCGCTTADLTATQIPPGKIGLVTVRFDAGFHDLRGQTVRRGLILQTNDPHAPEIDFWVQAAVQ